MEQVLFLVKQGHVRLDKLSVVYPFAARYLNGAYKPLLEVAQEVEFRGFHHLPIAEQPGLPLRKDSIYTSVPHTHSETYAHIQTQAMSALSTCLTTIETQNLPKKLSLRLFFPSHDARDIYASTFSPHSPNSTPITLLLSAKLPHLVVDMKIWRGDGGAAWAMEISNKSPAEEDLAHGWLGVDRRERPKGRDVMLITTWQENWQQDDWAKVVMDIGKTTLWKASSVNSHFGDPRELGLTLLVPSALSQ